MAVRLLRGDECDRSGGLCLSREGSGVMLDPGFIAVLTAGVFCGALVSSFAGFAFSPVAAILLIGALPPADLIPLLMVCSILVQLITVVRLGRSMLAGRSSAMLIGGVAGVPLAVMLLPRVDSRVFQAGFGLFLAAYALLMLRRPVVLQIGRGGAWREAIVGFVGGWIGGLTAMPGAAPVFYCDLHGLTKVEQRAIVQPFILLMQLWAMSIMIATGGLPAELGLHVALALPALGLGTLIGLALFGRVRETGFRRAVLVLLLVTGISSAAGHDLFGPQRDSGGMAASAAAVP
jgi:uncharacterized membrane protein YfcA